VSIIVKGLLTDLLTMDPRLQYLYTKYFQDTASASEEAEFWEYINNGKHSFELEKLLSDSFITFEAQHSLTEDKAKVVVENIFKNREQQTMLKQRKMYSSWIKMAAAAVVLITLSLGVYFSLSHKIETPEFTRIQKTPQPGNKAILTLADGRKVDLSQQKSGIVISNQSISYTDGTAVLDANDDHQQTGKSGTAEKSSQMLSLTTPPGGQYEVVLPDGSSVVLNAASKLKYPSQFLTDQREVELEGEAYFKVVKDPKRVFKVVSGDIKINVLGTEFNVNGYKNEKTIKTTLIEGAVVIENDHSVAKLKPGQQAIYDNSRKITIQTADVQEAIAWKDGRFYFSNTPFDEMLRQLARWYDLEVHYKDNKIPDVKFTGEMSRDITLKAVLSYYKDLGIKFRIEGKKIYIE
jgi:transmembrane sensor